MLREVSRSTCHHALGRTEYIGSSWWWSPPRILFNKACRTSLVNGSERKEIRHTCEGCTRHRMGSLCEVSTFNSEALNNNNGWSLEIIEFSAVARWPSNATSQLARDRGCFCRPEPPSLRRHAWRTLNGGDRSIVVASQDISSICRRCFVRIRLRRLA
jgi:hypothetical protein